MLTPSKLLLSRYAVPTVGLGALALFIFLYVSYPATYLFIMKIMIKGAAPRPFADLEWIPSSIRCWSDGVNVYVNNTCYDVWTGVKFNYSPLWLRARFLLPLEKSTYPAGILMCVIFFASLASLPPPQRLRDQAAVLLVTLSCGTFLAMERGNIDLVMFVLFIAALNLRGLALPFRLAGYALILLAGLLKFYPVVALIIVLRERVPVVVAVAIASVTALATLVLAYHQEFGWMAQNLPPPSYFTLQFSAMDLPGGIGVSVAKILVKVLHQDVGAAQAVGVLISRGLLLILVVATVVVAVVLGRRYRLPCTLAQLPARQTDYLVTGAALICGCFFAGPNVIYRGMFLLLALPGLATMSRTIAAAAGRRAFASACAAIAFVLWIPLLEACLSGIGWATPLPYGLKIYDSFPGFSAAYVLWLASELAWWWIITLLLAVLGAFVVRTESWALFCRMLPPSCARPPGRRCSC